MKRTVAFLAAVCLSTVILSAHHASAQTEPPTQTPPPPVSDASGDTLKTGNPAAETPKAAPAQAAPDTMSAGAKARRANMTPATPRSYAISLGIGSASNYQPDQFKDNFTPSFGLMLSFGVRQYGFTAGVNLNYNFFLAKGTTPNDLNIGTIMAELQYGPSKSKARPYIVVCGGYFRQWIVDVDYSESVLGYGGGAGVTMKIGNTRELFLDGRYIEGRTRETQDKSNTVYIPVRFGVTWEIK